MNLYERLYYILCQPAFARGKLAKNWPARRVYLSIQYFLVIWHGLYGALAASRLFLLFNGKPVPGVVFLVGTTIGLLALAYWAPSEARLNQLHKLPGRHLPSSLRHFAEMLAVYGLFLASIAVGYALLLRTMSL